MLRSNRYSNDAGTLINQWSRVIELQPKRPDLQVPITRTTQGVIDLTTPGQAGKLGTKYDHADNKALINVLYKK